MKKQSKKKESQIRKNVTLSKKVGVKQKMKNE